MHSAGELSGELARVVEAVDELTLHAGRLEEEAPTDGVAPVAFRHVVVAADGSEASEHALRWARAVAAAFGARVTAVHVVEPDAWVAYYSQAYGWQEPEEALEERDAHGREVLERAREEVGAGGAEVDTVLARGFPNDEVPRVAAERGADLVIVGSHEEGAVERAILGSVADAVRHRAEASVLVAKADPPARRALIAVDGSRASKRAAVTGVGLARALGTEATLFHVLPTTVRPLGPEAMERLESGLAALRERGVAPGVTVARERGQPAERILHEEAAGGYDLVVMGSRGFSGLRGALLGGVTNRVSHDARGSVLIVKGAGE